MDLLRDLQHPATLAAVMALCGLMVLFAPWLRRAVDRYNHDMALSTERLIPGLTPERQRVIAFALFAIVSVVLAAAAILFWRTQYGTDLLVAAVGTVIATVITWIQLSGRWPSMSERTRYAAGALLLLAAILVVVLWAAGVLRFPLFELRDAAGTSL